MSTIYLVGPITGCTYGECTTWREGFTKSLAVHGIRGLNPMREKEDLRALGDGIIKDTYEERPLSSQRGITARDYFDCRRADLIVANFLQTEKVSIGSVMEVAWAHAHRVPVILVIEEKGNPHDHAMLRECSPFRVSSLDDALHIAVSILEAYQ